MAIYITQGRYTSDAVKGMVANPENREKAVADLMEKAGAKLLGLYFTFGEYDFLSIPEHQTRGGGGSTLIAGRSFWWGVRPQNVGRDDEARIS